MRKYIKKLQSKPEDTRKQILAGSLIVSMSLVGYIWISSFTTNFNEQSSQKLQDDIKPFTLFGNKISETYSDISASVGNIKLPQEQIEEETKINSGKVIDLIPVEIQ
jgi:hypothetical protein